MPRTLHLDFETASEINIKTAGTYKYAMHPSTRVLMAGYALDHHAPDLWVPAEGEEMPRALFDALVDPDTEVHAFNAKFERLILWHVLKIRVPIERFRCTMVHAWSLSFSGNLGAVGAQMGLPLDKVKDARGKKLIDKFCKPAPKNHRATWYGPDNAPADWAAFKAYCIQDVIAEREIEMLLAAYPMPPQELDHWFWDQDVNDRGVPVDTGLVSAAVHLERKEKARLRHEMNRVTCLENANSPQQLAQWLSARGESLPDLQKETVKRAIKETQDPAVRDVLRMRAQVSKTSTKKWEAFQNATCDDGMLRGMFEFGGAQRTQRWAGRVVQLQNLKSPGPEFESIISEVVDVFLCEDPEVVRALYGDVLDLLSQGVRCAITAPDGYVLGPCDLSSIESRVLGYLSGCDRINRIFAEGKDTYKDFAMELFGCRYEDVTKAQRKYAKPPTLGCFAADTPVLTRRGWVPIVDICYQDELWDGIEWVRHGGVVYQGVKPVVERYGVLATADHRILSGGAWVAWSDLRGENLRRAIVSVPGGYSSTTGRTGSVNVNAASSHGCRPETSTKASLHPVYCAPTAGSLQRGRPQRVSAFLKRIMIDWLTGCTQRDVDARIPRTLVSRITEVVGSLLTLVLSKPRSGILSPSPGGTIQPSNWIEKIITAGTSPVISDLLIGLETPAIPEQTVVSGIWPESTLPNSSGENSHLGIETPGPLHERYKKERPQNKSLRNSAGAGAPTYDVLNAGPRSRFTVLTSAGPVIAHNCGYQLGGPGLIEYAAGMGVDMDEETAQRAVDLYRYVYPEVPAMWYWLVDSCKDVVQNWAERTGYGVRIHRDQNFLMIDLPSGRRIHYYQPLVLPVVPPWERDKPPEEQRRRPTLTYMGMNQHSKKWERLTTHGGKITENIVQAFARDVLVFHMRETEGQFGPIIRGHVHDEPIPLLPADRAEEMLAEIERIMSISPPWAPALLLGAKGFLTKRYRKD